MGLPLFHAAIMDCPYELGGKVSIDDALNVSKVGGKSGFMGANWDDTGVAFDPETWRAIADTLLPGAYLFVFAGNLNDDLISVAMRRAELVKQHKSLAWSNGSSLPKTTRVDSQVDAAAGVEGEVIGAYQFPDGHKRVVGKAETNVFGKERPFGSRPITAPATPLAQTWAGHRYGAQALRNLVEAILIFRKPYEGKAYESIVRHGSGALNIAGSRIGTHDYTQEQWTQKGMSRPTGSVYGEHKASDSELPSGRHPSNFYIQHTDRCIPRGTKRVRGAGMAVRRNVGVSGAGWKSIAYPDSKEDAGYADADGTEEVAAWECARDESGKYLCPVALLDEQAGELKSGFMPAGTKLNQDGGYHGGFPRITLNDTYGDTGGPSRFVHTADWQHEAFEQIARRVEDANAVTYRAKPSRRERDAGLDGFEERKVETLGEFREPSEGRTADKNGGLKRNPHPTVKSISLMKYLAGLLLPPDAYAPRRILIPFSGSGSECIAAALAGWEEVVGVELEPEYIPIARARIAWWQRQARFGQTDPAVILANAPPEANEAGDRQIEMFEKG